MIPFSYSAPGFLGAGPRYRVSSVQPSARFIYLVCE